MASTKVTISGGRKVVDLMDLHPAKLLSALSASQKSAYIFEAPELLAFVIARQRLVAQTLGALEHARMT